MLAGDLLSLVAAIVYAFHVVRLGELAPRFEPLALARSKEISRYTLYIVYKLYIVYIDTSLLYSSLPYI